MSDKTFSERLSETAEAMRKTGEAMALPQVYSHRNGETEPPTVEGIYFVCPPIGPFDKKPFVVSVVLDGHEYPPAWKIWHIGSECSSYLKDLNERNQWWGPVSPPWQDS